MYYEYEDGLVIISLVDALNNLFPNSKWSLTGYEYEGLDWQDDVVEKPTKNILEQEVERLNSEYMYNEYQRLRAAEYPPMADYLDGIVKNDQEQIQKYIDACQAVKDKYPKPSV